MSDNTQTAPPPTEGGQGSGGGNAAEITKLANDLATAKQALADRDKAFGELQTTHDGLKTANEQLNQQLADLKKQFETTSATLKNKEGEVVNWTTQHGQVTTQLSEASTKLADVERQLKLYKTISSNPDFHPLIGVIDSIKVVDDPTEQEGILKTVAGAFKVNAEALAKAFNAGGTPTGGGPGGGQQQKQGPKNVDEAYARLVQIAGMPGHEQETANLQGFLLTAQNNQQNGGGK